MKVYRINKEGQFGGDYNYLFILGTKRSSTGASDFTDADTSQTFNLLALSVGDHVISAKAICKTTFAGTSLSAVTASVGNTDSAASLVTAASVASKGILAVPQAASQDYACVAASKNLTATIATTGCNLDALTAGEVWIYAKIDAVNESLNDRYG